MSDVLSCAYTHKPTLRLLCDWLPLLCAHVAMMCSGRRRRIGKEAGSLFLPTEVCQTGIFWELQSEKISPRNSRCIDSFFFFPPLKDCDACSMSSRTEAVSSFRSGYGKEARDGFECVLDRAMRDY